MQIKVRIEEIAAGAVLGASLGLAVATPFAVGMPSLIPTFAAGGWGFVQSAIAFCLTCGGAALGGWLASTQERDSHSRGARYYSDPIAAVRALQEGEVKQFSAGQQRGGVRGIEIGGVHLARSREVGHVYAVGLPGSGKTVLLTSIIDQAITRGDRIILHDPKGDFIERYYNAKCTVLLGPWDERAAVWDASADIDSPALADEFGASVAGRGEGQNKVFHDGAGVVIAGLIRAELRHGFVWSWKDLASSLSGDPFTLIRRAAEGNAQIKTLMPSAFIDADELTQGEKAVLSVMATGTTWLLNYAALDATDSDRERFSLRRWLLREAHDDVQIVVLNSHTVYQTACESIFGAMLASVAAIASSPLLPEISADSAGGYWSVFDEFPQLGATALAKIQQIAELGRSRGMRMVTALQDESQLSAKVGGEKAAPMLAMQSTRIYMRSSDKTAEAVCKRVGEREVMRINSTAESGAVQGKTKQVVRDPVIHPGELMGLRVRRKEPPVGVELVIHIEDTLGKLVQSFPEARSAGAARLIESATWRNGSLPTAAPALVQPASEGSAAGFPSGFDDEGDEAESEAEQMNAENGPLNFL
ncbi:hypothetical protein HDE78_003612 [Rhodanobacter sp. K2T2]|uniref:type IV secretion system DNA-binding domain-containing protein n=1 Tax=Rhodanobacter sp. K2T2 TaxID=2723085 RepID=UPI0015C95C68|nr:type IV secretion system DNA-binding domain-containing protein [Rhodanobacter sp. K2T2]NYE30637.1 hypothetical protein [Rhodanobacter sp. K2T2]